MHVLVNCAGLASSVDDFLYAAIKVTRRNICALFKVVLENSSIAAKNVIGKYVARLLIRKLAQNDPRSAQSKPPEFQRSPDCHLDKLMTHHCTR